MTSNASASGQHIDRRDGVAEPSRPPGPTWGRALREAFVILLGALLYFFVRGLMETRVALAQANAEALIDFEQRLGLDHEAWFQSLIVGSDWKVDLANRIYIFGHWPVIIATFIWLIWRHGHAFATYRTALLLSGAIGLVCFVLVPMAPPRLLVDGAFVDTVTQQSEAYRVLQPPAFTNQYAAMPSLHVGWNLLMGIAIVRCAATWMARAFGYVMPVVMYLSTIATANHYILDGLVGSAVALTGLAIAWRLSRPASERHRPRPDRRPSTRTLWPGWGQRPAS